MNFVTLFPEAQNLHLKKDVGMIPYILHKEYGYNSTIVCYKNGEYPFIDNELKGLKIKYIKKYTGITVIDASIYILRNAKKIDTLHLFHLGIRNVIWIYLYKLLNIKGQVYIKLDANRTIEKLVLKKIKNRFKIYTLKKCKLVSVETSEIYEYIKKNWNLNIKLIPNGFYDSGEFKPIRSEEKENYIISVGRIGAKEKANEILMEAYAQIGRNIPNWKVKFIGEIEEEFKNYINYYFKKYPELKDKVIFNGPIYNPSVLDNEYRRAKIFCMTSHYESFGLVFVEAIKNGCYIVSSDLPAVKDITDNLKYGDVFSDGNINELVKILLNICTNDHILQNLYSSIQNYAYENFDWKKICNEIKINIES